MNNICNIRVLRIIFEGFCDKKKKYGTCILLLCEHNFSRSAVFDLVRTYGFQICSDLKIDLLIHDLCIKEEEFFRESYFECIQKGHSFRNFAEKSIDSVIHFEIPRFTELDFQQAVTKLGGIKVKEQTTKTPDFLIGNIAIEMKDLQREGLYDKERQKSISEVFKNFDAYAINIDPLGLGEEDLKLYKRIISNSIKGIVKKASLQIKEFKLTNEISSAGIILINTGFFSLRHELFKEIVEDIIAYQTKNIEFAYILTQSVLVNAIGDCETLYYHDFIGTVPDPIRAIEEKINVMIEQKMTLIFQEPFRKNAMQAQEPISFLVNNKIFYWTPRKVKSSWEL